MKTQTEHSLQSQCIEWFRLQYPKYRRNIWACPNARKCGYQTASYLKKEGVTAGVADVHLDVSRKDIPGLKIEFKIGRNKQTEEQKDYELAVRSEGYAYYVIRSFEEFVLKITNYMKLI